MFHSWHIDSQGWEPGIQEGAAVWDEEWDKFEDEGLPYTFFFGWIVFGLWSLLSGHFTDVLKPIYLYIYLFF